MDVTGTVSVREVILIAAYAIGIIAAIGAFALWLNNRNRNDRT